MFDQNGLLYLYIHSHRKMWKGGSHGKAGKGKPGGLSFEAWNTYVEGENQCMHIIG